jgi:hypothetical protein
MAVNRETRGEHNFGRQASICVKQAIANILLQGLGDFLPYCLPHVANAFSFLTPKTSIAVFGTKVLDK